MSSNRPFGDLRRCAYRVILMDAPTKFSSGPNRNPINHYPTMTISQIGTLPVGELAHPDGCRLILWITWPHLDRVPELLRGWGFKYCTGRPWLKLWPKEDGLILYRGTHSPSAPATKCVPLLNRCSSLKKAGHSGSATSNSVATSLRRDASIPENPTAYVTNSRSYLLGRAANCRTLTPSRLRQLGQ